MVTQFYHGDETAQPEGLHTGFEFGITNGTKISVVEQGKLNEYPEKNKFPPFWKTFDKIEKEDTELGMFYDRIYLFV